MKLVPFPAELIPSAWDWLNEFPKANFDDYGPRNLDEFVTELAQRSSSETEYLWAVEHEGEFVGMIGVTRPAQRLAALRGVCFARKVHGQGVAAEALRVILEGFRNDGVERFEAYYFVDNVRVHKFLSKLGFKQEGILRARTMRGGKAVDVRIAAIVEAAVRKGGDPATTRSTAAEGVVQ